jgi:hypothetical protein
MSEPRTLAHHEWQLAVDSLDEAIIEGTQPGVMNRNDALAVMKELRSILDRRIKRLIEEGARDERT